jgi:hypothetical protein
VATQIAKEPHRGTASLKGLAQMGMRWNDTADWYMNDIPAASQDLTLIDGVQFRAALRYNECTPGQGLDFTVQLIDSAGNIASKRVHDYSYALFYPPGTSTTLLPKVMFNTIRIPISSFSGINRAKVRKVKFLFNKTAAGSLLISDLAFVQSKCGKVNGTFGFTYDTVGYDVSFFDTVTFNTGDTMTRLWNFGNPASGTNDTSTLHNPTHVFTSPGTYTVCMYTIARRVNKWICTDTLCTTITITPPILVPEVPVAEQLITIVPNPARDFLQISGAEKTDVLRLINAVGQIVMTTNLTEPIVNLPAHLADGVYYVIIQTSKGMVHKKLVITR